MYRNFAISFTLTALSFLSGATSVVPAHATGAAGHNPNSTSGFFAFPDGGFLEVELTTAFTDIQRLSLPSGNYIANASAQVATNSAAPVIVQCIFMIDGMTQGESVRTTFGGTGFDQFSSLPLTVGFSINERKELALACLTDGSGRVFSQASPITAIRVDRLTVTTGTVLD
jgi:hypothetical protein